MPTANPVRPRLMTSVHMAITVLIVLSACLGPWGRLPTRREMTLSLRRTI